jgi:hypothetical protein
MSNVAVLSRAGSHADSEAVSEVVDIQKLFLPDQWAPAVLVAHLEDQAVSAVASAVVSMAAEDAADPGEAPQTVLPTVVVEEEALATKVLGASPEAVMAEGIVDLMDTERLQMLQLVQVVHAPPAPAPGAGMEALALRIAAVLGAQVVDMTRAVAVAHMMTDPADTAAAAAVEAMETAMHPEVEVVATWSR